MNHSGHREDGAKGVSFPLKSLCVLCGEFIFLLLAGALLLAPGVARGQARGQDSQTVKRDHRLRYDIKLAINFDDRTYTGVEQVHWVNHGDRPASTIFFHLYSNMRPPAYLTPTPNDA